MPAGLQCWDKDGNLIIDTTTETFIAFAQGSFYYTEEMYNSGLDEHSLIISNPNIKKATTRVIPTKFWYSGRGRRSSSSLTAFFEKQPRILGYEYGEEQIPYFEPLVEIEDGKVTLKYQKAYYGAHYEAYVFTALGYDFIIGNDLDDIF